MNNPILVPQKEELSTGITKESIVQTGEKAVYAANVNNLNVTQKIYVSGSENEAVSKGGVVVGRIAEKQPTPQTFEINRDLRDKFFNLFVVANDTDFSKKHFNIGKSYSIKSSYNTADVIERFGGLDAITLEELETLPCLFTTMCQHIKYKKIDPDTRVYLGKITKIDTLSESYRIHFEINASFPLAELVRLHEEFDIRCDWNGYGELTSIHWAVKNANLMYELNLAKVLTANTYENVGATNKNDMNKIYSIFTEAIKKYRIVKYLNADPESTDYFSIAISGDIEEFIKRIKSDIIVEALGIQKERAYRSIKQFVAGLEDYHSFVAGRVDVADDHEHYVLRNEEKEYKSLREAANRKLTGREEVRGMLPQKPSMFDGKGVLKVRNLDVIYNAIAGHHLLVGTAMGGWVDRDYENEMHDNLIDELGAYTSNKDIIPDQMLDVFRFAITKCRIIEYVNCDPTWRLVFPIVFITYFNETMNNLFKKYVHNQKEPIYGKIYDFNQALQSYNGYLSCHMQSRDLSGEDYYIPLSNETNIEWEHDFEAKVLEYRKAINGLYGEVCDGETMFVECGSM